MRSGQSEVKMWYGCRWVRCGKCRCRSCPHGPYWYGYSRPDGVRLKSRYFGRADPRPDRGDDWREAIFCQATATEDLARLILGVRTHAPRDEVRAAYLRLTKETHPDRGGRPGEWELVSAAWTWLKARRGWR